MEEFELLMYPLEEDEFAIGNLRGKLQLAVDEYNMLRQNEESDETDLGSTVEDLLMDLRDCPNPYEYAQIMALLLFAIEKRKNSRGIWVDSAHLAFNYHDLEISREIVIRAIEADSKRNVKISKEEFIPLSEEDNSQNIADILGMIVDELASRRPAEEWYDRLLGDFAKPLKQWRNLEVPKTHDKETYPLIYAIVENCYHNKAYHTAVRLSALLFVADQTKQKAHLSESLYLMGKILYELGYMEVAKRCMEFADTDTESACWQSGDEKYRELLQQTTCLELSQEVLEKQQQIDEKVKSGELKLYTLDEIEEYEDGELEIAFSDTKKLEKNRKKLGDKAIKTYEKSANATPEERLQAIDAAFAVFTEAHEIYPEAAYLYFQKGNIYLDKGDFETAYDCFKQAYNCKDGKRNGLVLLGLAIVLSQMGRMKESTTYLFRTYILCGKDFIIDEVGEEPWKMVEAYL